MILRELVTRLGFAVDASGADRYDARFEQTRRKAEQTSKTLGDMFRGLTVRMAVWNEVTDSIGQLFQKIGTAALAIPLAGDRMAQSLAAINNELNNAELSSDVYEKLYQSVRRTGSDIDDTARSFARYQGAMAENNRTTDETITLITGLQAAMTSAGMATSEVNSVTTQLGQALGSGTLSGDEYKSLRENLPDLVRFLRQQLGMTGAEMKKAAEDQKLTTDKLIEPLLAYARMSNEKLLALPPSLTREWSNFVTTITRFAAEIDKAFKFSETLARGIRAVSDMIERWRQYIPMVAAFVDSLGDLKSAAIALGIALTVAFGGPALAAARALAAALLPLTLKFAAFAALFLLIEDFVSWLQGKDSFFKDWLGDPGEAFAPLVAMFETVKAAALPVFEAVRAGAEAAWAALPDLWRQVAAAIEAVAAVAGPILAGIASAAADAFGGMAADGQAMGAALVAAATWIGENWRSLLAAFDLGPVASAVRGLSADGEALGAVLAAVAAAVVANWGTVQSTVAALREGLSALAGVVRGALLGAFEAVTGAIGSAFARAREFVDWLRSNLPGAGAATGAGSDPEGQEQRRRNFQNRMQGLYENIQPQSFVPQVAPGAMVRPAAAMSSTQSNDITINVPITATGGSGAEVAAGARAGVAQGARDMIADLGGVARGISMAMPRAETAAA